MAKQIGVGLTKQNKPIISKRTSQGIKHRPKNKHQRRRWKAYRGQGRP